MRGKIVAVLSLALLAAVAVAVLPFETVIAAIPDPAIDADPNAAKGRQTAVLAGGCFWCTEVVFEHLIGVEKVTSGYAGGDARTAHYELVAEGRTDHAEAVEIVFDPAKISYGQILKVFFGVAHDPTTLNRQGPDWGRQYRSAIFWNSAEQKRIAEAYVAQLTAAKVFSQPIVTVLGELEKFYPAEDYHQDFVKRNPRHPYVVVNALPKLSKLSEGYPSLVKK
jgi:peptide-methionine (S)-S-oxide reductase